MSLPLKRYRNQQLSLWQSVVSDFAGKEVQAKNKLKEPLNPSQLQQHPMVLAANAHAEKVFSDDHTQVADAPQVPAGKLSQDGLNTYLSELCFEIAKAKVKEDNETERALTESYRKYSDKDPGFLTCATTYAAYYTKYNGVLKYNDWQQNGGINYGVINYTLPDNAKVAIIGDWGTGMMDAECLLYVIMKQHNPDAIIHLGDIYYSATPDECVNNFSNVIDRVFTKYGKRVPVFTIPGNHDYYAFAYGYYDMVTNLNNAIPGASQPASYFCLRTKDMGWQFLGMDTGYDDANPADQFNTYYAGPQLLPSEIAWHKNKLDTFNGATLLLSHHQLFTGNGKINGSLSTMGSYPYLNKYLLDVFRPYLGNKVAAWLWGHEHNQVIYNDNLFGLPKGRLIGASAYEELTSADPYKLNYPSVPFNTKYELKADNGYYNHGYAIIDLSVRKNPTDKIKIDYYQYPSWGDPAPNPVPDKAGQMLTEYFSIANTPKGKAINYKQQLQINLENGIDFIGPITKGIQYYPTVGSKAVTLQLLGGSGNVKDGDMLQIQSLESGLGKYNLLGAWKTPALYYYTPGYDEEYWIIKKLYNNNDPVIYESDAVYFINKKYAGQYLCPLIQVAYPGITSLTSDAKVPAVWYCKVK